MAKAKRAWVLFIAAAVMTAFGAYMSGGAIPALFVGASFTAIAAFIEGVR